MPTEGFNYAPQAALALEAEASRIIRTGAFNVERRAKTNVQAMNIIDTGALLNANYTMTNKGSGYAAAAEAGTSRGRKVNSDAPAITSPLQARVVNAMEYAYYVHDGTRFVEGRPFMLEAAEAERIPFNAAWGRMHLVPGMGGGVY